MYQDHKMAGRTARVYRRLTGALVVAIAGFSAPFAGLAQSGAPGQTRGTTTALRFVPQYGSPVKDNSSSSVRASSFPISADLAFIRAFASHAARLQNFTDPKFS
jgi:hypothetical protein